MRMYDLIQKKKDGLELTSEEIEFIIGGYTRGEIPDYQMSAFTMAVYFKGMTPEETTNLTLAMAHSGDMIDLSPIEGIKIDKHSTGGVGDKTSMIVGPIAAANGVKIAKMSGKGLGHTGGTIDKLDSIPGFKTVLSEKAFFDCVNKTGIAIIGQSGDIAPADKKLYALRDVTATIDSIPLIASSIMSKKLAAGSNGIVLDVKTGSGAFMKTLDDSIELAKAMVDIGEKAGRRTTAIITDMDNPLGNAIGNSLEVIEAVKVLEGKGPADLTNICIYLAANMMHLAELGSLEECKELAVKAIESGAAKQKLIEMVTAQGGDPEVIKDTNKFKKARFHKDVFADAEGYVTHINTEQCGIASMLLGAGRETKESQINYQAGIILNKKYGDEIITGEPIATLYADDNTLFAKAEETLKGAYKIGNAKPDPVPLAYARVSKDGLEYLNK
ncbi:MAG: pyrimidine-nucleoside phosphorylase [Lachnospiraceae bacterium]|nr:pyrimidine-nucleoside phosphorylase [Lachnospiraceae bacterium]